MELLELLKEQEPLTKSITSEDKQLEMLNDWNEISASFTSQLKTPKGEEFKKLKEGGTYEAKENLDKLLDGWNLKNENSNSESMSSTKGLQAWLKSEKSPVELLMVLGIHKAVDRLANRLLISMNLEKWNFAMQLSDGTGRYNFEDKLKETLKAFCGDDNLATLFLKRLVVLRKKIRSYPIEVAAYNERTDESLQRDDGC
ncbi:unnamed protein product [Peronospora farinosa]|uniref:Uncharacterized protein n=1 Tax=Peronospora farinosa TaxID=134698 RepID=A0ABN8BVF0_9STRA|nr:unnamed protein product [Peronospora farinosa]